ncbi:hypothetical protein [Hymenobacter chitinivorans]|uniref:DUF2127 domain-containing protein n=1 Tax=Hymenobacter chitinivorans DSM 11115 TaxID=1121954 RepID=A0A2M9BAQ3_9BACT|nr:hypothetical protein [Hymenobacter chitinivorans]PJJ55026.1 hypothetical protein CLV45_3375 [Hymenobacter chitinivorans DSM 11115]
MARTALLVLLLLALVIELVLTIGGFVAPDLLLTKFGVGANPDTRFMAFALAWLLLFVSLVDALALWQVWQRQPHYATLCYLLGIWWIGIGLGLYLGYGRLDNLLLDTGKGLLIVLATWRSRRAAELNLRAQPGQIAAE